MNLHHLRYFISAVREGSLRAAAVRLNVAQPALSRRIRDLEIELGCALFERRAQGVVPTPAGTAFYKEVTAFLNALDRAVEHARQAGAEQKSEVRLGLLENSRRYAFIQEAIAGYKRAQPHAAISYSRQSASGLIAALQRGALDIALIYELFPSHPLAGERLVHRERFVLAVHPTHQLAEPRPAEIGELAGIPLVWLARQANEQLYDALMHQFVLAGVEPVIAHAAGTFEELTDLVINSCGACVTVASTMLSTQPGILVYRPIPMLDLEVHLRIDWTDELSPAAKVLLSHLDIAVDRHQLAIRDKRTELQLFGHNLVTVDETR